MKDRAKDDILRKKDFTKKSNSYKMSNKREKEKEEQRQQNWEEQHIQKFDATNNYAPERNRFESQLLCCCW